MKRGIVNQKVRLDGPISNKALFCLAGGERLMNSLTLTFSTGKDIDPQAI